MTDTRNQSEADELKTIIKRMIARARTHIPAIVDRFDAGPPQIITCTPAIRKLQTIDGQKTAVKMPQVVKVPLIVPYSQSSGFAMTVPINPGDTVLLMVADRSIDTWREFGGIQDPVETTMPRHHDITDSLAIVGCTPDPEGIDNYLADGIEIRNRDRSIRATVFNDRLELAAGNSQISISAGGDITIDAVGNILATAPQATLTGNLQVNGTITATGNVTAPNIP